MELKKRQHLEELFEGVKDTAFVALVYQYIDPEILKQYHTTIDIADDGDKIAQKLLHSIDALSARLICLIRMNSPNGRKRF